MTDGRRGTGRDREWRDQCRRWTGNRNRRCVWQGVSLEGSRRPGPGWRGGGGGGGGSPGHRVVGGREDGLELKGGGTWGPGGRSIATGLGRKPVGGCYSAEMRRPAIRSTAHDLILSYTSPYTLMAALWRPRDGSVWGLFRAGEVTPARWQCLGAVSCPRDDRPWGAPPPPPQLNSNTNFYFNIVYGGWGVGLSYSIL